MGPEMSCIPHSNAAGLLACGELDQAPALQLPVPPGHRGSVCTEVSPDFTSSGLGAVQVLGVGPILKVQIRRARVHHGLPLVPRTGQLRGEGFGGHDTRRPESPPGGMTSPDVAR